ncbi:unnamed protein product [Effrenium voratum]|nr:unnamed protein product [Effrenium voratum]CAJ1367037.1 unnamed protein product [Effrenium voratum]CAJ1445063.1 unnamed protein product [Effrenium voratum]
MVVAEMLAAACPEMLVLAVLLLLHNRAAQTGPQVNDFVEYFCGAAHVSAQLRANGFAGASLDILLDEGRAMDFTAAAGFAKLASTILHIVLSRVFSIVFGGWPCWPLRGASQAPCTW